MTAAIHAVPAVKMSRFPKISAMRPHSRRKQPNVSEYAETTHCRRDEGMSRSRAKLGSMMTVPWAANVYCLLEEDRVRKERGGKGGKRTFMKQAPVVVATMAIHLALENGSGGGSSEESVSSSVTLTLTTCASTADFSLDAGRASGSGIGGGAAPTSGFSAGMFWFPKDYF